MERRFSCDGVFLGGGLPAGRKRGMSALTANRTTVWALVIVAVLASLAGLFFNLSARYPWYDKALHFYTTFAFTLLVALWLYEKSLTGATRHSGLLVLTIVLIGLGLGTLWEIAEYSYDHLVSQRSTIKGKTDTMLDLVVDAIGALSAGVIVRVMAGRH